MATCSITDEIIFDAETAKKFLDAMEKSMQMQRAKTALKQDDQVESD